MEKTLLGIEIEEVDFDEEKAKITLSKEDEYHWSEKDKDERGDK